MGQIEIIPLELAEFRFPDPAMVEHRGVVMGYAIRYQTGTLLFDTGFGFGNPRLDAMYHPAGRPIAEVLRGAGIRSDEITAVANCHLHADHAGQNGEFAGIPIHVQSAEWERAHTTRHTILEWIDAPGTNYVLVEGDYELALGIRLVATPGHTIGHQSLVIDTQSGPVVLAGQACYGAGEWAGLPGALEGLTSAPDRDAYGRSLDRLQKLEPLHVYFGHDRNLWAVDGVQRAAAVTLPAS